jgi:hypothetical protein
VFGPGATLAGPAVVEKAIQPAKPLRQIAR